MEPVEGAILRAFPVSGLEHVRDLDHFDGPLLSQYAHPNGDQYLFYWCDCDDTVNRWMVLRVSEASVLRLIHRVVPLDYVIPKSCRDDFVYLIDTDSAGVTTSVNLIGLNAVPSSYTPQPGAYLERSAKTADEHSYSVLVEGGWSVQELGSFPREFSKLYSLLYMLNVLRLPSFEDFPWRGGFSSMHFFNSIANRIPTEDKPQIAAMQYASPGFIRFNLHGHTAIEVTQCIADYKTNNETVADAHAKLSQYIREHKLNDIQSIAAPDWNEHADQLVRGAKEILAGFTAIDGQQLVTACLRPFEAAKIARATYQNIRRLINFEKNGYVIFPKPSSAS